MGALTRGAFYSTLQKEGRTMTITLPTVHMNGTSRDELIRTNLKALTAVQSAIEAVRAAAPNGRDYYVQPVGSLRKAMDEHLDRLTKLTDVKDELTLILEHLGG
jgi:hypothetical protein